MPWVERNQFNPVWGTAWYWWSRLTKMLSICMATKAVEWWHYVVKSLLFVKFFAPCCNLFVSYKQYRIIVCMQVVRAHITHRLICLPWIVFALPQLGKNSRNIRATHDCLRNRIQAMHRQLKTCLRYLTVRDFCACASYLCAMQARPNVRKKQRNFASLNKTVFFAEHWSPSERNWRSLDDTLMHD